MSQPQFPDNSNANLDRDTAINQILSSIAYEELGLSHIINSEGEKIQYVLGTLEGVEPINPNIQDILNINKSVQETLSIIGENQMFLYQKMNAALRARQEEKPIIVRNNDANLSSLSFDTGDFGPEFNADTLEYFLDIPYSVTEITAPTFQTVDEKATYVVNGETTDLKVGDNEYNITITAEDGATTKTYKINIRRGRVEIYEHTANYQTFTSLDDGNFMIEGWGASGGSGSSNGIPETNVGKGAYVVGKILLTKGEMLYLFVGSAGFDGGAATNTGGSGGYNGGRYWRK